MPSFSNQTKKTFIKNNCLSIIISCIFLFLFILCYCFFYKKVDLFEFPFKAEVWGNAADWIVILITALTAYQLIKTYKLQKDINLATIKNYKQLIQPIFSVSKKIEKATCDEYFFELKLVSNSARNIAPSKVYGLLDLDTTKIPVIFFLSPNNSIKVICKTDKLNSYPAVLNKFYTFSYHDLSGNVYFQSVQIKRDGTLHLSDFTES